MSALPLPLAEFQSWMQAVLVHPDGAAVALRAPEARRFVAPEDASTVVRERGGLFVRPAVEASFARLVEPPFGLTHWIPLPAPAQGVLAFLRMDLSFYYWHVLNHRVPLFWRFHNVHHLDPDLDVSTALRFHFGELAFSAAFRIAQILVIGVSPWAYAAYEVVFQANTLFQHGTVRLPIRVERALDKLLVTPRMHGVHHSRVRRETNSNYGVVLPWWGRLHQTLGLDVPQADVTIGVPGTSKPEDNGLWNAVCHPFRRQRDYWSLPDGNVVEREASSQGRRTCTGSRSEPPPRGRSRRLSPSVTGRGSSAGTNRRTRISSRERRPAPNAAR